MRIDTIDGINVLHADGKCLLLNTSEQWEKITFKSPVLLAKSDNIKLTTNVKIFSLKSGINGALML